MRWFGTLTAVLMVVAAALWGMKVGWAGLIRRSTALLPELPQVPGVLGPERTAAVDALYVSTVRSDAQLDRVSAHGLGIRTTATVQVFDTGVLIDLPQGPLFLGVDELVAVGTSAGQAGKMLGSPEALLALQWAPQATQDVVLATALRVRHAADRPTVLAAARDLLKEKELR